MAYHTKGFEHTDSRDRLTTIETISGVTRKTVTNRRMVDDTTVGVWSASSGARINASIVDACMNRWTI